MEVRVRHMVTRDRQNINGIRLNVWRRRILQERFARNRSIITTWANFEATGKLFTLSWLPLRIIAELSAAMWNAAVIYSAWQRIVQSAAYKLNSVTKRKKEKKKNHDSLRKLLFRRTIRGMINRSRHVSYSAFAIDLSSRATFSTFRCQIVYLIIIFFFFCNIYPRLEEEYYSVAKIEVEKYESLDLSSLERWNKFLKRVHYAYDLSWNVKRSFPSFTSWIILQDSKFKVSGRVRSRNDCQEESSRILSKRYKIQMTL